MAENKVNIINGRVVPQFMGKPMQDAKPAKPEDNEVYALEKSIVTHTKVNEEVLEKQPEPMGGGVSSWNDLTDKPFYEEVKQAFEPIVWDGVVGDKPAIPFMSEDDIFVKIASLIIENPDDIASASFGAVTSDTNEWLEKETPVTVMGYNEYGMFPIAGPDGVLVALIVKNPSADAVAMGLSEGVWFYQKPSSSGYTTSLKPKSVATTKTLDPKYLPEALRFGEMSKALFAEETVEVTTSSPGKLDYREIVIGDIYSVQWDGVLYTCKAFYQYGFPALGDGSHATGYVEGAEYPFFIAATSNDQGTMVIGSMGSHVVSVSKTTTVPLDEKYLPMDAIVAAVKAAL